MRCTGARRAGRPGCGWRWAAPAAPRPGSAIDRQAFDFLSPEVLRALDPGAARIPAAHQRAARTRRRRAAQALTGDPRAWARLDAVERLDLFVTVVGDAPAHAEAARPVPRRAAAPHAASSGRDEWLALMARAAALESDPVRRAGAAAGRAAPEEAAAAAALDQPAPDVRRAACTPWCGWSSSSRPSFARTQRRPAAVAGYAKWRVWRNAEADAPPAGRRSAVPRAWRRGFGAAVRPGAAPRCWPASAGPTRHGAAMPERRQRGRRRRSAHPRPRCATPGSRSRKAPAAPSRHASRHCWTRWSRRASPSSGPRWCPRPA